MRIRIDDSTKPKSSKRLDKRTKKKFTIESTCMELEKAYPECALKDKCCYVELPYFALTKDGDVSEHIAEFVSFQPGKRYRITIEELG